MGRAPTAPVAAATFVLSWAVVEASGSRALGGVVLAAGGVWCVLAWAHRRGWRTASWLGAFGLFAFAFSHVLGLLLGPWPAVLIAAAAVGMVAWSRADRPVRLLLS